MKGSSALKILEKNGTIRRDGWGKEQYWAKGKVGLIWNNGVSVDVNNFMMFLLDDWKEYKEK